MKKIITVTVIILTLAAAALFLKKKKEEIASLPTPAVKEIAVETAKPKIMRIEEKRVFLGSYLSVKNPSLSSKISGFIEKIYAKEGESVEKNAPLVSIDDKEIKASIKAQEAILKATQASIESLKASLEALKNDYLYAKSVYERNLKLYKAKALPKEKLDFSKVAKELKYSKFITSKKTLQAKTEELKAQQAKLKSQLNLLSYTLIKAPFKATVAKIYQREGDLAMPGKPLVKILSEEKKIEFPFSPKQEIKKGMKVYIEGEYEAKITQILPQSKKSLSIAKIELKKALPFKEDQSVKVFVVQKEAKGTAVPLNAILERGEERFVFVYENGSFSPIKIKILSRNESYAVIDKNIKNPVAIGSNDKLSKLFFVKNAKAADYE